MAHLKQHYKSLDEALALVADARTYQTQAWPSTKLADGGERPFEAQLLLVEEYTTRLRKVWKETSSYVDDGNVPNVEGRKRVEKYAAIVANAALWLVQAATGEEVVEDSPLPGLDTVEGVNAFAKTMGATLDVIPSVVPHGAGAGAPSGNGGPGSEFFREGE